MNEGSSFKLKLSDPQDDSSVDTAAGFEYAFDCGDGYGSYGATTERSCSTTDDGLRAAKAKIKDKDGGEREYTASVTVQNVAPAVTAAADQASVRVRRSRSAWVPSPIRVMTVRGP